MPSIVIMAGGVGERFWPASTTTCPKQYLPLTGNLPMILETYYRVKDLVGPDKIYVVTTEAQLSLARQILSDLPMENVIVEPEGRNTAPCITLAAAHIKRKWGNGEVTAVLPADHYINDNIKFQESLKLALDGADNSKEIITFGIKPDRPETGYGYLHIGPEVCQGFYKGIAFIEKPDIQTAQKFFESGNYFWNSGIFIFKIEVLVEQMKKYAPGLYNGLLALEKAQTSEDISAAYQDFPQISIDYGLMEKLSSFLVIPGTFGWDDVGTWRALEVINPKDSNGNVIKGTAELMEVYDSIIYAPHKLVAAIGVKDLVMVETPEATLICAKERLQEVKQLVQRLKISGLSKTRKENDQ